MPGRRAGFTIAEALVAAALVLLMLALLGFAWARLLEQWKRRDERLHSALALRGFVRALTESRRRGGLPEVLRGHANLVERGSDGRSLRFGPFASDASETIAFEFRAEAGGWRCSRVHEEHIETFLERVEVAISPPPADPLEGDRSYWLPAAPHVTASAHATSSVTWIHSADLASWHAAAVWFFPPDGSHARPWRANIDARCGGWVAVMSPPPGWDPTRILVERRGTRVSTEITSPAGIAAGLDF